MSDLWGQNVLHSDSSQHEMPAKYNLIREGERARKEERGEGRGGEEGGRERGRERERERLK